MTKRMKFLVLIGLEIKIFYLLMFKVTIEKY